MFPILCDLDGVVWLTRSPIAGSVDAVARLRAAGHRVLFVTNNSSVRLEDQESALAAIGIPAEGDVLTSAMAAAMLLAPGSRAVACAADGVVQALEERGVEVLDPGEDGFDGSSADAVVVGWHRTFDFERLHRASAAVRSGARLVATNDDATYPTASGLIPGGGALLAAVETAAGAKAEIAGKPFEPMATLVREWLGTAWTDNAVMVGDRPSTDGRFARRLGCRYAQVWSGVTSPSDPVDPRPDLVGDDLAAIADALLEGMVVTRQ